MKFVIFDIDGTLTNTKEVDDKCFIKAFHQTFNLDIQNQKWEELQNVTDWGITEEIIQLKEHRMPSESEYSVMKANLVNNLREELSNNENQFDEIPYASHFFNTLYSMHDIHVGIATGAWEESAKIKLSNTKISLENVGFSNSNYFKRRESIVQSVIDQLVSKNRGKPTEIIYFGDGIWDYTTCQNLGIRFIGIDYYGDGRLRECGAETVYKDFSEWENILKFIT